jgi:hypothetical protein
MRKRPYYSIRTGKNPHVKLNLDMLQRLFCDVYKDFDRKDYFQEAFGYHCPDGDGVGTLGTDIEAQMTRRLRKTGLWPIFIRVFYYSEDDLFDVIEFLHDIISVPVDGPYHSYCGQTHYNIFDSEIGKREFRDNINELLRDYKEGYELSSDGEILALPEHGMVTLMEAVLPADDPLNVNQRVEAAILKYRRSRSTLEERKGAIQDLADVLEYLRPKLKKVLETQDESDLFNIANNFEIRHHNVDQKTKYDKNIWLSWMFYFYLATIHAATRLIEKQKKA